MVIGNTRTETWNCPKGMQLMLMVRGVLRFRFWKYMYMQNYMEESSHWSLGWPCIESKSPCVITCRIITIKKSILN